MCHGVAILRFADLSNGEPLVKGKTVTGFANVKEELSDRNVCRDMGLLPEGTHVMPWRIEDELKFMGRQLRAGWYLARVHRSATATSITGQQNFSGGETAELILEALGR